MTNTEAPQIAIFGGSFNPPTVAHQQVIGACLRDPSFDEVWVMPSGERTDKDINTHDRLRLEMLEAMKADVFDDEPRLQITDFELKLPQPTQTYQTVGALTLAHPDANFWYVYGADSYASMPTWEGGDQLQAELPLILLPRDEYELPPEDDRIKHLTFEIPEISGLSSTEVRRAVSLREAIGGYVCEAVCDYILVNNLYAEHQPFHQ